MNSMVLKDKIAIVTGGSRGLGKAIALLLSLHGSHVTICGRDAEALHSTCKELRALGGRCEYIPTDVSDEAQVLNLITETFQTLGRIDILINNAGVGVYKPLRDTTLADWDYVMGTNLKGAFLCTKAVTPIMIAQGNGDIVNVASGAGRYGIPNLSIYCSSKFGLIGLSDSLSQELLEFGIRVSHICPGYIATGFFEDFPAEYLANQRAAEPEVVARQVIEILTSYGHRNFGIRRILKKIVSKYFR